MNPLVKVFVSGAAGVLLAESAQPFVDKYLKPDNDFMKRASKVAVGGASAMTVYWILGATGVAKAA